MTASIDRQRLQRAIHLATPIRDGDFTWSVAGYTVSPLTTPDQRCTCPDVRYRPGIACKHQLAVQLYESLGYDLFVVLRELVPRPPDHP